MLMNVLAMQVKFLSACVFMLPMRIYENSLATTLNYDSALGELTDRKLLSLGQFILRGLPSIQSHVYHHKYIWIMSCSKSTLFVCLPPSVADNRKWVPYFLIRLSVIIWEVGLRPRSRMFLMNSEVRGNGDSKKSLLSTAKLFTFHLPNSLHRREIEA